MTILLPNLVILVNLVHHKMLVIGHHVNRQIKLIQTSKNDPICQTTHKRLGLLAYSPWEPPWALEELDIVGFMIDSGLKLSHEQHEPDWQNCSLEHFALISAN